MSLPRAPLSRTTQMRVLGTLMKGPPCVADEWEYAVSDVWIGQLKDLLNDHQTTGGPVPPMTSSFNDTDNIFLGESIWKVLVSWYGLGEDYNLHRRLCSSKYMQVPGQGDSYILADKHLDFIHISVCLLDHIDCVDKQHFIQVFFWEDVNFLELLLCRSIGVSIDQGHRIWASIKKDENEVFLGTLDSPEICTAGSFGGFLSLKLPGLREKLKKRHGLPPPTASQASLDSFSSAKGHLAEVLQRLGISIMLCLEETGRKQPYPLHQRVSCLSGISPNLVVAQQQHDWSRVLDEALNTFEKEVQFLVKTKRDEVCQDVEKLIKDKITDAEKLEQDVGKAKAELGVQEKRFKEREKDLDEREHDLNVKVDKFKRGLTDYLMQRKKLEEELKRIEEQNIFTDTKVELNVGGSKYTTSTITLTKEPDSLLALMFSGRHHVQKDADGSYFIDRDGTNFRHILNYMRDGMRSIDSLRNQTALLQEILVEADFFRLSGLSQAINAMRSSQTSGTCSSMPAQY
ncbi:uncharacterized protein [Haliotis cracherodii]|uniref:uncharacterized protein n=1 Tax=Haliotis cracherodii TaxID=6455 RepID=UPI0039ECDE5D